MHINSLKDVADIMYPIGSIYMSVKSTDPATLFGGSWELWGAGKVPVGVNTTDTDFSTVEKTGGEKTHQLTVNEMAQHNHSVGAHTHGLNSHTHTYSKSATTTDSHTLTVDEIPSHNHLLYATANPNTGGPAIRGTFNNVEGSGLSLYTTGADTGTRGGGKGHTHEITLISTNSGQSSGNTASSTAFNSGNSGSSTAHNNLQPYITCYMFKRVG